METNRKESQEQSKLIRLIEYLTRLASLRTRLVRDVAEYEQILWLSSIPREKGCFTQAWGREEDIDSDVWIEIQNLREPELPCVPETCENWIEKASLRNKMDLPELLSEITIQIKNPAWQEDNNDPEYVSTARRIEDYPKVQRSWEHYVEERWFPWMEKHNQWEAVHKVYSALFAIYQEQIRLGEEYELVLGLGHLTWKTPTNQQIRRHLIVANALLEFEARLGKFTVHPMSDGASVRPELDMLDIEERPTHAEETANSSLENANDDPWEKGCIEGVLQALVHSINSRGEYDNTLERPSIKPTEKPVVEYAPALILRKRSAKGLTETLRKIKDRIENGGAIPPEFGDLAEIRPGCEVESNTDIGDTNRDFDGEIFFPKPSNEEQRRIVDKIRAASGVLVQGPPGTGKSHTIANLICHLLATGQRLLITAKTPRALQVLEGLVPDELQPLCINLLGSGLEERRSLESSVGGILRKNEDWDEDRTQRERIQHEGCIQILREEKARIDRRLRDIRESETHSQSIAEGTYRGTAARIAEAFNRDRSAYDWFTDIAALNKSCPVSESGMQKLLAEVRHFTSKKRRELSLAWPDPLPANELFINLIREETRATEEENRSANGADEHIADLLSKRNLASIEVIRDTLLDFYKSSQNLMASPHAWMSGTLRDVLCDNSTLWHKIFRATRDAVASMEGLVKLADNTTLDFPVGTSISALREDACKLKQHIEEGGKLGWGPFRPKPVKECINVIKTVRVNGHPCSTLDDFSALVDALHVRLECESTWGFWIGRAVKTQGPYTLQLHELSALSDALESALSLRNLIENCRNAMHHCPEIGEPAWSDKSQIERLIASCRLALARHRKRVATEHILSIEAPIASLAIKNNSHPVTSDLIIAIRERDTALFAGAVNKVHSLEREHQRLEKLDQYFLNARDLLPRLVGELQRTCGDSIWDERLRKIKNAWHWAQAKYWLEDYIRKEDVPLLEKRAKQIEDEINASIAKLASLHAWSFCFSRLKEDHRRHMEAWQQSMRRLGKGTGKHAPRHRREAQQHLNECREAVPAWVMPLHRVWDTVDPAPGIFDIIIVDEASQCGIEALPLFYLGKKILIVGDDKQISPEVGFINKNAVFQLMEEFLYDFSHKDSFHRDASLFDHGKLRYGTQRITLREHFRCMPEIISFSNNLCYSDTPLIPLRQYGPNRLPPLEHVFVNSGYREGRNNRVINRPEAEAVIDKIVALCRNDRYSDKTIGVVVLQGEAQARLIEEQLLDSLGAEEMDRRRLVCGNPYSFQGDERDVMILSMVAATNERIGSFSKPADERRFNVAASRARDQMHLFHSVTINDLSVYCLRRQLLEFFESNVRQKPDTNVNWEDLKRRAIYDNRSLDKGIKPPAPFHQPGVVKGSWFEVDVALAIHRKGYRVIPQFDIAGKHIDLVVEGEQAQLAVECFGDRWHGIDNYEADMQRQRQLERCGWEFFIIRESTFYVNQEKALDPLWQMLEERDIFPYEVKAKEKATAREGIGKREVVESDSDNTEESGPDYAPSKTSAREGITHKQFNHWIENISSTDISNAIVAALEKRPNYSCTLHSLTASVLKELSIRTRGKPWKKFDQRVMRILDSLEENNVIEKYKAKNDRVRLIQKARG